LFNLSNESSSSYIDITELIGYTPASSLSESSLLSALSKEDKLEEKQTIRNNNERQIKEEAEKLYKKLVTEP